MNYKVSKRKLFDIIFKGLPIGCFLVDKELRIISFNDTAKRITGWDEKEVIGKYCSDVLQSNLCKGQCPLKESLQLKMSFIAREATITTRFGERVPICFSSSAVFDDNGEVEAGIEIFRDMWDNKRLQTMRNRIMALFAHDIKSPVAMVGGMAKRLMDEKVGPLNNKQKEYLEIILKESKAVEVLLNNLLELLHIESGRAEKRLEPTDLSAFISDVIEEIRPKAMERSIEIRSSVSKAVFPVYLDRIPMRRVLINLLDNAIKYSKPNSVVSIDVEKKGEWLLIKVRDQGIGIPKEDLPYIFDYFYRGRNSKGKIQGTGIGLSSARAIVEEHGGRIWATSEEGQGTTFFIRLPYVPDP